MQFINQDKLALISPMQVVAGVRICYYSPEPIVEGTILYTVTPERTILFKTGRTKCQKLRRAVMVLHVDGLIHYTVTTYLQEINDGLERDKALEELMKLKALPY
jgi:hypothetical protein